MTHIDRFCGAKKIKETFSQHVPTNTPCGGAISLENNRGNTLHNERTQERQLGLNFTRASKLEQNWSPRSHVSGKARALKGNLTISWKIGPQEPMFGESMRDQEKFDHLPENQNFIQTPLGVNSSGHFQRTRIWLTATRLTFSRGIRKKKNLPTKISVEKPHQSVEIFCARWSILCMHPPLTFGAASDEVTSQNWTQCNQIVWQK